MKCALLNIVGFVIVDIDEMWGILKMHQSKHQILITYSKIGIFASFPHNNPLI